MLCKKFDMLCKIRQRMNCNVFFRWSVWSICVWSRPVSFQWAASGLWSAAKAGVLKVFTQKRMERKASRIAIRTCSAWTTPLAYGAYHSGGALLQLGARFLGIYGDLIQVVADDACQPTNILDCFQWRVEHKLFIFLRNLTFWSTPIFFFRCTTLHIFEIVDFQLESRILPLESD